MADRNSNLRRGIMLPVGSPDPADPLGTPAWQVLKLVRRVGLPLVQNLEPAGLDETEGSGRFPEEHDERIVDARLEAC